MSAPARLFQSGRPDGRSDAEVIEELVMKAAPGDLLEYDTLAAALWYDGRGEVSRSTITAAVRRALPRLLKKQARALENVVGAGYRIAEAARHQVLASERKTRADRQMARGVQLLEHVDWDAMDDNQRRAHEGQLLLMSGLYRMTKALDRRQRNIEQALANLQHQRRNDA